MTHPTPPLPTDAIEAVFNAALAFYTDRGSCDLSPIEQREFQRASEQLRALKDAALVLGRVVEMSRNMSGTGLGVRSNGRLHVDMPDCDTEALHLPLVNGLPVLNDAQRRALGEV